MNKKDTRDTPTQKNISCWHAIAHLAGVTALLICMALVFILFPRQNIPDFDYQGILVGILAGLFTLIVGWNIYQMVDMKSEMSKLSEWKKSLRSDVEIIEKKVTDNTEQIQEELNRIDLDRRYQSYIYHYAIADIYASLTGGKIAKNIEQKCIRNRVDALAYASNLHEWDLCKSIAKIATSYLKRKSFKLTEYEKQNLIETLVQIDGKEFAEELSDVIAELKK